MSPVMAGMLGGTPIVPSQPVMAVQVDDGAAARRAREESATFDLSTPNSPRIFRTGDAGGSAVKSLVPLVSGRVVLDQAETTGNSVDRVNVRVTDSMGNALIAGVFSIRWQHEFSAVAGATYLITAATDPSLAVNGSAALALEMQARMKG